MDRWSFMVFFIFAFCVLPYGIVVAETVELKVYSNFSNVIIRIITTGNNQNLIKNQGLKILQSESKPDISGENPMIILVPQEIVFTEFLSWNENHTNIAGFCIEVFKAALQVMGQNASQYQFIPFNGTYDELLKGIHDNKTIDGEVGDITILENRAKIVDLSAQFTESEITLPGWAKDETPSVWMVFKPFSKGIWLAMIGTFVYTGLVVWFLEHGQNSEFRGPWPKQFGTTVSFIFSTLFFAHRERYTSNYSRIIIMVWLFLILVMVSCFVASLSSMLTAWKLAPEVNDLESLRNYRKDCCDDDSFPYKFLKDEKHFKEENVAPLNKETVFDQALREKCIVAVFIEIPYLKVFLEKYSDKFKIALQLDQIGGLAFAFRKGSPSPFSTAILPVTETEKIADLESSLLYNASENWNSSTKGREIGLTIDKFWVPLVFSVGTSIVILIIFKVHLAHV